MTTKALNPYKIFVMRQHFATFRGKHNSVKAKALMALDNFKGNNGGMTTKELMEATGCGYTLYALLIRWVKWHYVDRDMSMNSTRMLWHYKIAPRGTRFVEQRLPLEARARFLAEIKAYRDQKQEAK